MGKTLPLDLDFTDSEAVAISEKVKRV